MNYCLNLVGTQWGRADKSRWLNTSYLRDNFDTHLESFVLHSKEVEKQVNNLMVLVENLLVRTFNTHAIALVIFNKAIAERQIHEKRIIARQKRLRMSVWNKVQILQNITLIMRRKHQRASLRSILMIKKRNNMITSTDANFAYKSRNNQYKYREITVQFTRKMSSLKRLEIQRLRKSANMKTSQSYLN